MRTRNVVLSSFAATLSLGVAGSASAQVDVEPPMPNVMVLLDSSGSMMRDMDGNEPTCVSGSAALHDVRWFALVQALTGDILTADIGCNEIPRTGNAFTSVYGLTPPDLDYYIPFLQLTSQGCGYRPNPLYLDWTHAAASEWTQYPADAILAQDAANAPCPFVQRPNGVLDAYKRSVRFGLMTFDPLVDNSVGISGQSGGNAADVDLAEGQNGTWSYWYDSPGSSWYAESGGAEGTPPACGMPQPMEVGARGPAAPPWEGRLMGFGYERATAEEVATANTQIEDIIRSMRPFGATPLSGMVSDLRDLILNDEQYLPDPGGDPARNRYLGAKMPFDTLWQEGDVNLGCRPFHVILITDGEPNLDLRPDCTDDNGGVDPGVCPFDPTVISSYYDGGVRAGERGIVNELYEDHGIIFHVVGVALNGAGTFTNPLGGTVTCGDPLYTSADGSRCAEGLTPARSPEERTCCLLNSVQDVGSGGAVPTAAFATSSATLRTALDGILADIASGTATRTTSVYQTSSPTFYVEDSGAAAVGHEVRAALTTVVGDGVWGGQIARSRITCTGAPLNAFFNTPDDTFGDRFEVNLAANVDDRFIYTAVSSTAPTESWRTLRPRLGSNVDGVPPLGVTTVASDIDNWVTSPTVAGAMSVDAGQCTADLNVAVADCPEDILRWYMGLPAAGVPTDYDEFRANPLGGIYHSQPVLVGPPREFVRDEAYDAFARLYRSRPTVLYAASVDGQLHAFKVADNDAANVIDASDLAGDDATAFALGGVEVDRSTENNELWSFVPPIVLSEFQSGYNKHAVLLDGGITVANLPATRTPSEPDLADYLSSGRYRTFLVGSSGRALGVRGGGYYYGLDVTDPRPHTDDFDGSPVDYDASPLRGAPNFLWQIARGDTGAIDDAGSQLFGESVPAAAVTTINYRGIETAVAILAGGLTNNPGAGTMSAAGYSGNTALGYPLSASAEPVRLLSRDWGTGLRPDRSVTVVRMSDGEILMRFVGQVADTGGATSLLNADRVRVGEFNAPMSGTPVAYPGLPGQVSTRVFIGDADGILWALDMSDPEPDNSGAPGGWKMQIVYDPYGTGTDMTDATERAATGPVETVPIVSVNDRGNPVVLFATGSQEDFYRVTGKNYVVSVTGTPTTGFTTSYAPNWSLDLSDPAFSGVNGQRVTGPLNLFGGVTYFSTFVPNGDSCSLGSSRVWGLDYDASAPTPLVDLNGSGPGPIENPGDMFFTQAGTVFGVTIGQLPTCRAGTSTNEDDDIFGGYSTFTSSDAGIFQLIVQTGRPAPLLEAGGTLNPNNQTILRDTFNLPQPAPVVQVDSWAAIVE